MIRSVQIFLLMFIILSAWALSHEDNASAEFRGEEQDSPAAYSSKFFMLYLPIIVVLMLGLFFLFQRGDIKARRFSPKVWLPYVLGLILFLGIAWSYDYSKARGQTEIITNCDLDDPAGPCFISWHIHAFLNVEICGEQYRFPLQSGDLDYLHTHTELNKIHWHALSDIDRATGGLKNNTPYYLGTFAEYMGLRWTADCLGDYCNGDICPGASEPGKIRLYENDIEIAANPDTIWYDAEHPLNEKHFKVTFS